MKHLAVLFVLLFTFCTAISQDLHVYYNAFTDSLYYKVNGKTIVHPLIRKGSDVVVHIENFNNYLYRANIRTATGPGALPASGGGFNLGNVLHGGGFNLSNLVLGDGESSGFGLPKLLFNEDGFGFADDSEAAGHQMLKEELTKLESSFNLTKAFLTALDAEMGDLNHNIRSTLETQQIQSFAADEIRRLRFNPRLEPRQIKQLSQEYMDHIFGEKNPEKLTLSKVIQKADANGEVTRMKQDYMNKLGSYSSRVDALKLTRELLQDPKYNVLDANLDQFRVAAQSYISIADNNLKTYSLNSASLDTVLSNVRNLDINALIQLRTDYLVMSKNDFTQVSRHKVQGDDLNLYITLTPVDSVNVPEAATRRLDPISLKVYGGLQIKGALGLSFGGFFKQPQEYSVRDSIIRSSSRDAFTPFLTSYVNFYRQGRGAASFGGAFGIGLPIGGQNGLEAITFFLGPSLVLGRNQGVVLNAGLLGGKAETLSGGYAVGDRFDADPGLLKTKSIYRLGYFFGIAFNLLGQ